MEMFSEIEMEDIINEFLNKVKPEEEVEEEEIEEDEIKKSFITERRFEKECNEHFKIINKIETKTYIPLKNAMIKYMQQTGNDYIVREANGYSYSIKTSNWWYLSFRGIGDFIEIQKSGNRWVCSKEKLDAVDFYILNRYRRFKRRFD